MPTPQHTTRPTTASPRATTPPPAHPPPPAPPPTAPTQRPRVTALPATPLAPAPPYRTSPRAAVPPPPAPLLLGFEKPPVIFRRRECLVASQSRAASQGVRLHQVRQQADRRDHAHCHLRERAQHAAHRKLGGDQALSTWTSASGVQLRPTPGAACR